MAPAPTAAPLRKARRPSSCLLMDSSAVAYSIWPFLGREDAPFRSLRQGGEAPSSAAQFAPAGRFLHVAAHAARAAGLVRACEVAALQIQLELRGAQRAGVRWPCTSAQPSLSRKRACSPLCTPFARAHSPRLCAMAISEPTMAASSLLWVMRLSRLPDMVVDLGGEYARLVDVVLNRGHLIALPLAPQPGADQGRERNDRGHDQSQEPRSNASQQHPLPPQ